MLVFSKIDVTFDILYGYDFFGLSHSLYIEPAVLLILPNLFIIRAPLSHFKHFHVPFVLIIYNCLFLLINKCIRYISFY